MSRRARSGSATPADARTRAPAAPATRATPSPPPGQPESASRWALLAVLAIVAVSQAAAIAGLRKLPDPLFGGDLHYQMGCIRSIRASLDPMASCSTSGALPGYLPLHGTLIAALSWIARLDVFAAMKLGAVLLSTLSAAIVALVGARLLGRTTGVLLAGLWCLAHPAPIARYTELAGGIVAPLLYLALALFLLEPSRRSALLLGLMLAVAGWTHAVLFTGAAFLVAGVVAIDALRRDGRPWPLHLRGVAARAAIVLAAGALALGYWWKPIFHHGGRTSPHYTDWNGGPSLMTLADRLDYAASIVTRALDPRAPVEPLVTLLALAGAVLVARRGARAEHRAAGVLAALTAAWVFHFFVTMPLLGVHFVPEYVVALLWGFARFLLAGAAIAALIDVLRVRAPAIARGAAWAAVPIAALGGLAALANPALESGRAPLHPSWTSLQRFVESRTRPDDVFLSSNELSFALAALTGRKVMTTRRAQNDAFLDMDPRNLDAARILYGRDPALRRRLLERHGVKYVLWTDEWASTEFYLDESGRVAGYDDPLLWFQDAARDSAAAAAGVRFAHVTGWVDPSLRGERYPRFPLTIVTPDNYARPDRPWHPDLDALLERVWSHEEGGRTIAALYRVRWS